MGRHSVRGARDAREMRAYTRALLQQLAAFERMLEQGTLETGARRVGVEQELFLVHPDGRPACIGPELLAEQPDPRLTSELARFNLEANLDPTPLDGGFLSRLASELREVLDGTNAAAGAKGASVLLTGILPSLHRSDLVAANISPEERYEALDRALRRMRGEAFSVFIQGIDELALRADSVVLEAANTSLQLHLQVDPDDFARAYNVAQLVSAPLLAVATGSPLLLGRRLWHETRVALFERSVDPRPLDEIERERPARVLFGDDWVRESALELFRDNVARFRPLLICDDEEEAAAVLRRGEAPALAALALHNGTVWRWNRPCYGTLGGRPHVRIENRVLPAGPSLPDEVANAAFFYGMMLGFELEGVDPAARLPFERARTSFLRAARDGLDAHLSWLDGREVATVELVREELLPLAYRGLRSVGVPEAEIDTHLGIIGERVRTGRTPSRWMLESWNALRAAHTAGVAAQRLTETLLERQGSGAPAHTWPLADAAPDSAAPPQTVADIMTTGLFTVQPQDLVELATSVMQWRALHHVPVEDADGSVVGLVSHRTPAAPAGEGAEPMAVASVMDPEPETVPREMPLGEAVTRLRASRHGCLLVLDGRRLAGIVTERDFERDAPDLLPS